MIVLKKYIRGCWYTISSYKEDGIFFFLKRAFWGVNYHRKWFEQYHILVNASPEDEPSIIKTAKKVRATDGIMYSVDEWEYDNGVWIGTTDCLRIGGDGFCEPDPIHIDNFDQAKKEKIKTHLAGWTEGPYIRPKGQIYRSPAQ